MDKAPKVPELAKLNQAEFAEGWKAGWHYALNAPCGCPGGSLSWRVGYYAAHNLGRRYHNDAGYASDANKPALHHEVSKAGPKGLIAVEEVLKKYEELEDVNT